MTLSKRVEGALEEISGPQAFNLKALFSGGLVAENREAVLQFEQQTAELYRAVMGANRAAGEIEDRIAHLVAAVTDTPSATEQQAQAVRALSTRIQDLQVRLSGDDTVSSRAEPVPLSLTSRVATIAGGSWGSQSAVTGNYRASFDVAAAEFPAILSEMESISADLERLESELEAAGAPWTPARLPQWSPK